MAAKLMHFFSNHVTVYIIKYTITYIIFTLYWYDSVNGCETLHWEWGTEMFNIT